MTVNSAALARAEVPALPAYNAGLSSDAVRARYGVAHIARLGSNENPYGCSPRVVAAMGDLARQIPYYPDASCSALREVLAVRHGVQPEQLVLGNGSEDIIQMLCQAFTGHGDVVLTQRPSFGLHEIYPRMMGATVELVALTADLEFDLAAWCAALQRAPKLAFISNPSNPVGCMWTAEQFAQLLQAASPDTLLVVDEAYVEYAQHTPGYPDTLALLQGCGKPWVVLRTFSKAWGLAGLRVGYGVAGDAATIALLDRVRTPFNVNQAAQIAALAALKDEAFMRRSVQATVTERDALAQRLRAAGLRVASSATNFLFMDLGQDAAVVAEGLLAQGIITKPWKEPGFSQFLRVSVGLAEDNKRFALALASVLGRPI
ncbi:histidinol-phosphate transaminase [Comamonas sp. GB3 AK4-5]|uniref:histidinol-phosphate transaminase n=1 Tax=Comamonas sp. GB3 AK4-5 TaxID=3231487 RepID=UPI00351E06C4